MTESNNETTKPISRSQTSMPDLQLLSLGGYGLLAYGVYSLILVVMVGGTGPEAVLGGISQTVSLFPVLYLGPIFIFSNQDPYLARLTRTLWSEFVRWFVLIMAICYLSFIPLAFFHQYILITSDSNVVTRLNNTLQNRKKEIMSSLSSSTNPQEIKAALSRYPEISNVNILPNQTNVIVLNGISSSIDQGINSEVERLTYQQQARARELKSSVRTASLGSLVSGFAFLTLENRLIIWLQQGFLAVRRTIKDIDVGFKKLSSFTSRGARNTINRLYRIWSNYTNWNIKQLTRFRRQRINQINSRSRSKRDVRSSRSR